VRLNEGVGWLFTDCIEKSIANYADEVLLQIEACYGGALNGSRFGVRACGKSKLQNKLTT